jgi:hypothetical protein
MGKKYITILYNNEIGDYNQSLNVARFPFDDPFLQHTLAPILNEEDPQ